MTVFVRVVVTLVRAVLVRTIVSVCARFVVDVSVWVVGIRVRLSKVRVLVSSNSTVSVAVEVVVVVRDVVERTVTVSEKELVVENVLTSRLVMVIVEMDK